MISHEYTERIESLCCSCVVENDSLQDDGRPVLSSVRIGRSILLYGKRKSNFPFHCLIGPDWPLVVVVIALIVSINVAVLYVISPLGWPPVLIGIVGFVVLLSAFCYTAFSDPGIIYNDERPSSSHRSVSNTDLENPMDIKLQTRSSSLHVPIISASSPMPSVPNSIECGQCKLQRPYTARHCDYCKVCIDRLDHHCPW